LKKLAAEGTTHFYLYKEFVPSQTNVTSHLGRELYNSYSQETMAEDTLNIAPVNTLSIAIDTVGTGKFQNGGRVLIPL